MTGSLLTPRLEQVRSGALRYFTDLFGKVGLKEGTEIDPRIKWKPDFHLRSGSLLIAVEVDDNLDPIIFKLAALDIIRSDYPITVYLACPLEVFQADTRQEKVRSLKHNGFGIITVDDAGNAAVQHNAIPLAQHITDDELGKALHGLPQKLRTGFRSAHTVFSTNIVAGLQEAGQIVEALVNCLAEGAIRKKVATKTGLGKTTADILDCLYNLKAFKQDRAALGSARAFAKEFRNVASHPAKSAKAQAEKIRKCKMGFFEAIRSAKGLNDALKRNGYTVSLHLG